MDIEELIKYHGEGAFLDFKLKEYIRENRYEMVKDVMALANSDYLGNRYIIIGIKKKVGEPILCSIDNPKDGGEIEEIIHANIEPELNVEYRPFPFEGNNYVVLTIRNPTNQPYIAKNDMKAGDAQKGVKQKNGITKGDCWVRKGEHKVRATRKDFDRMYLSRLDEKFFKGDVEITFSGNGAGMVTLSAIKEGVLPSELAEKRIRDIIDEKEALLERSPLQYEASIMHVSPLTSRPYENRSLEELRRLLDNLADAYEDKNLYYVYEKKPHKINLRITNNGKEYIEDASIQVRVRCVEGLFIANKVHRLEEPHGNPLQPYVPQVASYDELNYPNVNEVDGYYEIKEEIGNIRHNISQYAFTVPLRLVLGMGIKEREIKVECTLRGKNLKDAIVRELKIQVI